MSRVLSKKIINRVMNNADDGYISGTTLTDNTTIEFGNNAGTVEKAYILFDNVFIPKNAVIKSAKLRYMAANTYSGTNCNIRIYGVLGYAALPTDNASYNALTTTTAYRDWMNIFSQTQDKVYESIDFTAIVQEIINNSSWPEGGSIEILLKDHPTTASSSSARRSMYALNTSASKAPKLVVTYEIPATITNDPPMNGSPISWTRTISAVAFTQSHPEGIPKRPTLGLASSGILSGLYTYQISFLIGDPISGEFLETSSSNKRSIFTASHSVSVSTDLSSNFIYTGYRIYRSTSNGSTLYLLKTIINPTNNLFIDNIQDSDLDTTTTVSSSYARVPVLWNTPQFPYPKTPIFPISKASASTYTNPTGRRYWITSMVDTAYAGAAGYAVINDGSTDFNVFAGNKSAKFLSAIPVHTTFKRNVSSITTISHGVVAPTNDGIIPIIKKVTNSTPYVVPKNKLFYLQGVGADNHEMFTFGRSQNSGSSHSLAVYPVLSSANSSMSADALGSDSTSSATITGGQSAMGTGGSPFSWGVSRKAFTANTTISYGSISGGSSYSAVVLNPTGASVTFDTTFGTTWSTSQTSVNSTSGTIGANSNRMLLAMIITRSTTGSGVGVKSVVFDTTQSMVRLRQDGRGDIRTEIWGLLAPNTGASKSAVVTFEEGVTAGIFSINSFYNVVQTLNSNMLRAKVDGVNTHPILAVNDAGGPRFRDGIIQPVPSYMVFGPDDELSCSDSVSGNGIVIYGYEIYKDF